MRIVLCLWLALTPAFLFAVDYREDIKPILRQKCYSCHGALKQEANLRLDTVASMRRGGDSGSVVEPSGLLLERVSAEDSFTRMPPEGEPLTEGQVDLIRQWIEAGAEGPVDERPQTDPKAHWAFQPLSSPDVPRTATRHNGAIDAFIERRLSEAGLSFSPHADEVTLIRRAFLDLHGLPPAPEEVAHWSARLQSSPQAWPELIDKLLASPRYGERWAVHWLDVVRYADTHGYEVNTPRPNAWPYRDYVIDALNEDTPYHRFVMEQLAGDQCGADPATGFMVAAAALLPGQIGKDEASKRLARQDALDEIIVGTSATFLGLTVGCARCHDHKFDPISQEDYYAMQAFFAGVEYGNRPIHDAEHERRLAEAAKLAPQIEQLASQLSRRQPYAFTGRTVIIDDEDAERTAVLKEKNGHGTNPDGKQRGYRQDVGDAGRVANISGGRYTWWDNVPGEDVFVYRLGAAGRFRLWISWGVHGSGVHTRDARYVLDLDGDLKTAGDQTEIAKVDQYYFAGQSEGESEKKPLWSGLLDVGEHDLPATAKLVVRGGDTGTGVTADVIVLQEAPSSARLPSLRGPVSPLHNVERFDPTEAKFVRFTTLETIDNNRHEPCIDELEVFSEGSSSINVAAAERGAKATSSGNYSDVGRHQLNHINDGRYGNGRSWISNERGGGWVQLEFPHVAKINRIEWARDREGKFKDRLPVRYRIEASLDGENWTAVATSDDRAPLGTPHDETVQLLRSAPQSESSDVRQTVDTLRQLKARKAELEKPRMVYSGVFRTPDVTRRLQRGDPEQPQEVVAPHVPAAIGSLSLPDDAAEADRRVALANWIASQGNPLTARVMVNRIWQHHFGRGLVETPSDFGLSGAAPSHPELLDWLASEFIAGGWSIKRLHRQIMSSHAYRQSWLTEPRAQKIDSGCKLLWRFPSRRLEAEAIRDSILSVSGNLNLEMGGSGFDFFKTRGGLSGFPPVEDFGPKELRRFVYSHKIRMEPVPVFGAFDCPDAGQATPKRSQSTTAIQALNLFNSPFVNDQASAMAERIAEQAGPDLDTQIARAFQLTLGRRPFSSEARLSRQAVSDHGLATLCRVLFNSNEFLFLP